jgi:alpha-L-fucosidase
VRGFIALTTVIAIVVNLICAVADNDSAPAPYGPTPSEQQLRWHKMEFYGFIHFGINTFTNKEWGYGDEDESIFNPSAFDARQWVQVARDAGMKGLILTVKHHDGFCLWPSSHTDHSVKRSLWRNGHGDVVGELAKACQESGLKFGVYLSPWDRNRADYGKPSYLNYYRSQLQELLTQYGPVFEVWFDGANGGDGYYGGTREMRRVDNRTYYEWPSTWNLVRSLQSNALLFSDAGPDIRWVGNELGAACETSWYRFDRSLVYPGQPSYSTDGTAAGQPDGPDWAPPETDISIRPGWFYHSAEDAKVKSLAQLLEIYYASVGRGSNLLLNVPPDQRGLIADADASRLRELRRALDATFAVDLARNASVRTRTIRGKTARFAAGKVNDGDPSTYWATDNGVKAGTLEFSFPSLIKFDRVVLQEFIPLGQRIEAWALEAEIGGKWQKICEGTTVGYKRIARFPAVISPGLRVSVMKSRACPTLATIGIFSSGEK